MPSVLLFVGVVAFVAASRLHISAYGREAWAVLAIAALAVPMLSKTNWPYYYLEPFILLLVWEFTSMHDRLAGVWRWPVLSFAYLVVAATLSQYIGLQSVGALDRILVGLIEFAAMGAFAFAIWRRMGAAKPASALAGQLAAQAGGAAAPVRAPLREMAPHQVAAAGAPASPLWPGQAGAPRAGQADDPLWGPESTIPGRARLSPPTPAAPPSRPASSPGGRGGSSMPAGEQWPDLDAAWPPRPPAMGER
jgi:hypothetical protein